MPTRMFGSILVLVVLSLFRFAGAPVHAQRHAVETIWTGHSGGYHWRWTTADLTATDSRTSRRVFSAAEAKRQQEKGIIADPDCRWASYKIQPLSVVGSIAIYQSEDDVDLGGAHPIGGSDIGIVDLARRHHKLLLTDLFSAADILQALLGDPIIQKALKVATAVTQPRTLPELMKTLNGQDLNGDPDFPIGQELLSRFAFHHLENGKVAVRLFVFGHSEAGRHLSTQLGLLLPIPAKLAKSLARSANGREGFLMERSKKLARDRITEILSKKQR